MRRFCMLVLGTLLYSACGPTPTAPAATATLPATAAPTIAPAETVAPLALNPLTGQPAADPDLLGIPAQLISISHFPALGRPQAGLSFAPFVYEISITEGATRFLAVFYGEYPAVEDPPDGDCAVRWGAFRHTDLILGGRVWLDVDDNGLRDVHEQGVGGVCVNLLDADANLLAQTTTDSNGYYGFDVPAAKYILEFAIPTWAQPSNSPVAEPSNRMQVDLSENLTTFDIGLFPQDSSVLHPDPAYMTRPQVGPIRSGRLVYRYLADSFPNSCLIYAGASSEVLVNLPQCHLVFHQFAGGGYMLDIEELQAVAKKNRREQGRDFDYGGYAFSEAPPPGGVPATQLNVYIAYLNQSGWTYDPLYGAYLRQVDSSLNVDAGVLYPDRDRLTGRQLHFENVIVLLARHDVVSPTNLDIRLDPGKAGDAYLFRDGLMYQIEWSMPAEESPSRMLTFSDTTGAPIPLKPGHTWVLVVTPFSGFEEQPSGEWTVWFAPPEGAK